MKATDLVLTQHREIEQLFEQLETADEGDKKAIREELAQNLVAHAVMEQEHLYPALKKVAGEEDEIDKAYVEHGLAAYALAQLLAARPNDETFRAKGQVLKDVVMHHVQEEETDMLKKAEAALGNEQLMRLGEEMQARFEQVQAKGYKPVLRQMLAASMPQAAGQRAGAAKKTAAKAPAGAKRAATGRRGATRQAQEARQTPKRGVTQSGRKGAAPKGRQSRAGSR